jgi:hypothetical protein
MVLDSRGDIKERACGKMVELVEGSIAEAGIKAGFGMKGHWMLVYLERLLYAYRSHMA